MSDKVNRELIGYLADAQAMEQQALELLRKCIENAGDDRIAEIYRAHRRQTERHARDIDARLEAHGAGGRPSAEILSWWLAPELGSSAESAPDTAARLAISAYAFENLEIAAYHLLRGVAQRAGDQDTVELAERILEEEEAAAELLAGQFDRVLEVALS